MTSFPQTHRMDVARYIDLVVWQVALSLVVISFALVAVMVFSTSAASAAETATIEATAPIGQPSEAGILSAISVAVQRAVRGATAMGLPWVQLGEAYVSGGYVGVKVFASAEPIDDDDAEDEAEPTDGPAWPSIQSSARYEL
jgi:hypothetical protein